MPTVKLRTVPWRVTAGRVLVNALAVALVVLILPGVKEYADHPLLGYLLLGALFGLLNAFVKPAIQFVALPLLLGSMGLVLILINILVFWILEQLTPLLGSSGFDWVALAGVLLGLLTGVLDNLLGLVPPILSDRPERELRR
jgi:putative membrane protein